jgi:phage gpG-like protein
MEQTFGVRLTAQLSGDMRERIRKAQGSAREAIQKGVILAAAEVQRRAKINVKEKLNTTDESKGTLARSIGIQGNAAQLSAAVGPAVIYGRIHEEGGVIRPVHGEWLVFKVKVATMLRRTRAGHYRRAGAIYAWIKTKKVTIPARPYLRPALESAEPFIQETFLHYLKGLFNE